MKKWLPVLLFPLLVASCKDKKKQPVAEEVIKVSDFIDFFSEVKPPLRIADSSFRKKDTTYIAYKTFTRFVPDSLLSRQFGKNVKPLIYPFGKITVKKQETYLFIKAITATHKTAFVLVFDKDQKFVTGMPLLVTDNNSTATHTADIDSKYSITTNTQRKNPDGQSIYKKAVYAYITSSGAFTLILTESNDHSVKPVLINPIDTLPRKNKLSGDYVQDKINLISVRDSKKPNQLLVFIHFEKDDGTCRGELKGAVKITGPGKAIYQQAGDQCVLQLSFSGNSVSMREEEGCGSHRDIKCFFEGSFIKKPAPKPVKAGKKKG
jgi:hypothetical protein